MNIPIEISRPHYHPGPNFDMEVTKKRDLSVPPHWVANERIEHPETGESYAIVMPPRDEELWEDSQAVHIHMPEYVEINVNGATFKAKVKVSEGETFAPTVHFDHIMAESFHLNPGDVAEL